MVNNGTLYYDHDRDGTHTQIAGCEARFRNVDHETYLAIRYENDKLTGMEMSLILLQSFLQMTFLPLQFQRILITNPAGSHVLLLMVSDYRQDIISVCRQRLAICPITTILLQ